VAVYSELVCEFTGKIEDSGTRSIKKTGQTMIEKILSITDIVLKVLIEVPEARDNDELLRFKVHAEQRKFIRTQGYMLDDYARLCISRKFASHESIRRARQKLQELHPELKGDIHQERERFAEEMRQTMPRLKKRKAAFPLNVSLQSSFEVSPDRDSCNIKYRKKKYTSQYWG